MVTEREAIGQALAGDGGREDGTSASPAVSFQAVSKRFGDVVAVERVDLTIERGEFFSLLGPSGSGKTTCLRMIAGFDRPSSGRIMLMGRDVTKLPPYERDVNTVFQDYALFPHMTVVENVAYGLMVKGVGRSDRSSRARDALRLVRLEGMERRKPSQLSGGQRQRVALARALVNEPSVLLLDEPLGALDLKLRQEMQVELKAIQRRVGLTFVYVTHDQDEALSMSDRLAVLSGGSLEQVGTPAEVYERPATAFVAGFVGVSNLLDGKAARAIAGSDQMFTVRPEKIRLVDVDRAPDANQCSATGRIREVTYLGAFTRYLVTLDAEAELVVTEQNQEASAGSTRQAGQAVRLLWDRRHNRTVDASGGDVAGEGRPERGEA